ncbi:unnamed protein product [Paramecium sonneborni]|uniref:UDP-N-acetylglucosamine--dolichyl-phosphate N-acetylglucosaminephosphotransferase n=1 Tax=Paramecium sonneborni TaxID=65129 RepID=A0A8S1QDP1_9CILI|nr:unnamed protein product [Paramecium sonneborni]
MFETKFIPFLVVSVLGFVLNGLRNTLNQQQFIAFLGYMGLSVIAYVLSYWMIPKIATLTVKADIFGYDINKKGTEAGKVKIPESLGIVPATIYLIFNILGILFTRAYMPDLILSHISGLLAITFIVFLGFADDVLDLAWRYKLLLPPIASLPVIVAYTGGTQIVLPLMVRPFLGQSIDLGPLYYLYMIMLSTFQSNAINIYAGVNGLEVGQSIIIALSIAIYNIIEISTQQQHLFSLMIIVPYILSALALYNYNRYPSKVFVGDVFCYWSGMTFAVAAVLGHFSKTLMLFCIPQLINFLYSLPQLFGIIPCPRHRLPRYDEKTGLLYPIKTNLTLINLVLLIKGPTSEKNLCRVLLSFQILCTIIGFTIRYLGSQMFF